MTQLQTWRAEADRDSKFDTTGCYAQHIQQIEQYYRLYSNQLGHQILACSDVHSRA
jgi:hypothetical protein